jgi:peptide/nickel transport system substrate-binding protein
MPFRDRWLIAGLSLALVGFALVGLAPAFAPAGDVGPAPSALPVSRPYVEGVLGHATNASPFGARSAADRALVALLFRGLVRLGPDGAVVSDLAVRWEVDASGQSWTFHLRPGLLWQDGTPLTADDVAFTVRTLSDPTYTGPGAASWRDVTAVATDSLTVTLRLATPLGGFLNAATQPIAPEHLLGGIAPADLPGDPFGQHPVGSGPFALTFLDASRAILVAATPVAAGVGVGRPDFQTPVPTDSLATPAPSIGASDAVPYLSGLEFVYYDDVATLRVAWDNGTLDAASGLSPADAVALGATPGARVVRYPGSTLLAVNLDLRPSRIEFRDPAVRRALLEAIDRDAIVADAIAGLAVRADSIIPPTSTFFDLQANPPVAYDAAAAQAALKKAGWKQSAGSWVPTGAKAPLSIEVLCPEESANPVAYAVAASVVADWRAIGINAHQTPLPADELLGTRLHPGGFQAAVVPLVIGLDPDLYPLLASTQTRTGGANVSGLQDPSLDTLLSAARAPGSDAQRQAAYAALQARLTAGVYILPIAFRDEYVVLRDTVSGPEPRPVGTAGDRFWDVLTWRLAVGR